MGAEVPKFEEKKILKLKILWFGNVLLIFWREK